VPGGQAVCSPIFFFFFFYILFILLRNYLQNMNK